jgi:hypothetical protein
MHVPMLFFCGCEFDKSSLEVFVPWVIQVLNICPCLAGQVLWESLIVNFP